MGDWTYYLCVIRMRDIAERVQPVADIHDTKTLSDWIQRQLQEGHSDLIKDYLKSQDQRLFNALVIGIYGGAPEWCEVSISPSGELNNEEQNAVKELNGTLGFLRLQGTEELFAIDGQHRVVGIKKALEEAKYAQKLGQEEVAALFVAHTRTKEGIERTRRLFTVLNRHAKAVSNMELIALDDDDVIAIVTRRLTDRYALFKDKLYLKKGKNIPSSDETSVTSIIALYDALNEYFKKAKVEIKKPKPEVLTWNSFIKSRPSDEVIEDYYQEAVAVLDALVKNFPPLAEVANAKARVNLKKYRSSKGGNLLFRPIGFQIALRAIRLLTDNGHSVEEAAERLSKMPWELNSEPWSGLLWNATGGRIITQKEHQKAALKVIAYGTGLDLKTVNSSKVALEKELRNLEVEVKLKRYVH